MAKRISSETMTKARVVATVVAMIVALASPIVIPIATATYNQKLQPSYEQTIFTLTDSTLSEMTCPSVSHTATVTGNEGVYYNGSVLMDLTAQAHYGFDIDGVTKYDHLILADVPPTDVVSGEDDLRLIFNVFTDEARYDLPMYPTITDGNDVDYQVPRGYHYSYYAIYIYTNLTYDEVVSQNQVNCLLSVKLQHDQSYSSCQHETIKWARLGFLSQPSITYGDVSGVESNLYTKAIAVSSENFEWNLTLSEVASISRDKSGARLWIALDMTPWVLYADTAGIVNPQPFELEVNFTATATKGPYTVSYMDITTGGAGVTGIVMMLCGITILSNIPITRTYVHGRRVVRIKGSAGEVNEYAKARYMEVGK